MNELRNKIINKLVRNGFKFTGNVEESHYYFKNKKVMVSYVTPHEGNGNNHLIRGERIESFERWGSAQYEEYITSKEEINKVIKELQGLQILEED